MNYAEEITTVITLGTVSFSAAYKLFNALPVPARWIAAPIVGSALLLATYNNWRSLIEVVLPRKTPPAYYYTTDLPVRKSSTQPVLFLSLVMRI